MFKAFQNITTVVKNTFTTSTAEDLSLWVQIPSGRIRIEGVSGSYIAVNTRTEDDVEAFLIGRYPVTNTEFSHFIEAGGYDKKTLWTEEGWHYRQREKWTQPKYFNEPEFSQADYPVVGVTWYEAIAYCQWLNTFSSEENEVPQGWGIILPSEQEWQRAAQGDDGRSYPWGNDFKQGNANTQESAIGRVTSVRKFLGNVSPYGVADMAGNVLEWTCTDWDSGSNELDNDESKRVLRGGSFANSANIASVTARTYSNAYFRKNNFGFRIMAIPFQY